MSWFVAVLVGILPMLETNLEYFIFEYIVKTSSGNFTGLRKGHIENIICFLARLDRSNYSDY